MKQVAVSVIVFLLLTFSTVMILLATGTINKDNSTPTTGKDECKNSYISPKPFKVGYLTDTPQPTANNCETNVTSNATLSDYIYPINPGYVNYNLPPSPECDNIIFNSSP
jgi:hypothetical protein